MLNKLFFRNRLLRQINMNGMELTFVRYVLDDYGQKTDEIDKEIVLKGIFHQNLGNKIDLNGQDASLVSTKTVNIVTCLYEDAIDIEMNDELEVSGDIFKVVNKVNIGMLDTAMKIYLEVLDNGIVQS